MKEFWENIFIAPFYTISNRADFIGKQNQISVFQQSGE